MEVKFNFSTMKFEGLTVEQLETWERLYPKIDVFKTITVDMAQWLDKVKGTKKANKRNWRKFICNWLKREQIKAVGL
jgi:hypothetical protein